MAEIGAIASDNNLTSGNIPDAVSGINRGSFFSGKNEAEDVQSADMSFGDFLDMINPLQHIPVASAIYRAATGETINPISRIAGDALYGGALGPVSAGLSALGAISDEAFTANSGQSATGTVVAALFGNDAPATQLAIAPATAPTPTQVASLQTPAKQSPIIDMPNIENPAPAQIADATTPPAAATQNAAPAPMAVASNQGIALDRSKPAYGGVMDSTTMQSAAQNQQLALSMASRDTQLQAQRVIRNSRFAVAPAAAPATTAANTMPAASATAPNAAPTPTTQAAMQNLLKELQAMKSVNSYKNAAQMTPVPGGNIDLTN